MGLGGLQHYTIEPSDLERTKDFYCDVLGFTPVANTPVEFGERIKAEIARWGQVVRDAKIRAD